MNPKCQLSFYFTFEMDSDGVEHGSLEIREFPGPTVWRRLCGRCARIEEPEHSVNNYYLGYWQCTPYMPIFVMCLVTYCYVSFLVLVVPRVPYTVLKVVCVVETTVTLVLFLWSYFGAVCLDPGYLPFTWLETRKSKYSWEELMSGTAARSDQFNFVKDAPRPPGCSFSHQSGRYVIRADHICGWIANWVGKRNHKQFILLVFWGGIFAISMFCWRWAPRTSLKSESETKYVMELANTVIYAMFGIILPLAALSFTYEVASHKTRIQKYKGTEVTRVSTKMAMRAVCGDGNMCCWICPTPAFPDDIPIEDFEA